MLCEHYDDLRARAESLTANEAALSAWLRIFAQRRTLFRGVADEITGKLHSKNAEADTAWHPMRDAAFTLVTRAEAAGAIRQDVTRPTS